MTTVALRRERDELEARYTELERAWDEVNQRSSSDQRPKLQASLKALTIQSEECDRAGLQAIELEDSLLEVQADLKTATIELAALNGTLQSRKTDLATAKQRLTALSEADGDDNDDPGSTNYQVEVEETSVDPALLRKTEHAQRILADQKNDSDVLIARNKELADEIAALKAALATSVSAFHQDRNGSIGSIGSITSSGSFGASMSGSSLTTIVAGTEKEMSAQILLEELQLLEAVTQARRELERTGEQIHTLRSELNRAKLETVGWNSGVPGQSAQSASRDSVATRHRAGTTASSGSRSRGVSSVQESGSQAISSRTRGQSISLRAPPKPPKPSPTVPLSQRPRFGTMA